MPSQEGETEDWKLVERSCDNLWHRAIQTENNGEIKKKLDFKPFMTQCGIRAQHGRVFPKMCKECYPYEAP